ATDPPHLLGVPRAARAGEEVGEPRALLGARHREQMDQHDGPLPLPDVAVDLLAVASPVAEQVEEVVLDLEGGAEEEAEAEEAVEVPVAARADERADAARPDGRVPARLLEDHLEVVRLGELGRVVPPPAELDRLALDRLARHALGLLEDAHGEPGAEPQAVVQEGAEPEKRERVADVHRERDAMERVERRPTAPLVALVLDVVVDEEGVVEELERDRRAHAAPTRTLSVPSGRLVSASTTTPLYVPGDASPGTRMRTSSSPSGPASSTTSSSFGCAGSTVRSPCATSGRPAASGRRSSETSAGRSETSATRTRVRAGASDARRPTPLSGAAGRGRAPSSAGEVSRSAPPDIATCMKSSHSPKKSEAYCAMRAPSSWMSPVAVS